MILLNGQIQLEIHQSGHAMHVRQWWFRKFLLEMFLSMVEKFPFHFSNHMEGFS
jgi:hypothetical protein